MLKFNPFQKKRVHMLCPACNVDLMISDGSGVEIDYCPKCRGVWLNRGELDKIIERSIPVNEGANSSYSRNDYHQSHHNDGYYEKEKRESWTGELFGL